jgi:hypothetical protein
MYCNAQAEDSMLPARQLLVVPSTRTGGTTCIFLQFLLQLVVIHPDAEAGSRMSTQAQRG